MLLPTREEDITLYGLIYEKIKHKFPQKRAIVGVGLQPYLPQEGEVKETIHTTPPQINFLLRGQFRKTDESAILEVGSNVLVVHKLQPYSTWSDFKSMILENFGIFRELVSPRGFRRISLRYLNIFEFEQKNVELEHYFYFRPHLHSFASTARSFYIKAEYPFEDANEALSLTLASIIPSKQDALAILLDIEYAMLKPEYVPLDELEIWLEKAHDNLEKAFESSITDATRELLGKEETERI